MLPTRAMVIPTNKRSKHCPTERNNQEETPRTDPQLLAKTSPINHLARNSRVMEKPAPKTPSMIPSQRNGAKTKEVSATKIAALMALKRKKAYEEQINKISGFGF